MNHQNPVIFVSWSGELSRQVAGALKEWFGEVFESLHVWVSDVDIDLGSRALPALDETLDRAIGAILVLTVENQSAPWVNFEAGALSRQLAGTSRAVIPLLVDADNIGQLASPLSMFQGALLTREGMEKVVSALFELQGKNPAMAKSRIAAYWPRLEEVISSIRRSHEEPKLHRPLPSTRDLEDHLNRIERLITVGRDREQRAESSLFSSLLFSLEDDVRERLAELGLMLEYWAVSSRGGVLAGIPGCDSKRSAVKFTFNDVMKRRGIYFLFAFTEDFPRLPGDAGGPTNTDQASSGSGSM